MRFQPAIGNRAMNGRAVSSTVATRFEECMVDRAVRYPACVIGLKRIGNFEQLRHRGFGIGERSLLFESHRRCLRSYLASASLLFSAYRRALAMSSSLSPARIAVHAILNFALQSSVCDVNHGVKPDEGINLHPSAIKRTMETANV
jgi:hypothetical protein